MQVNGSGGYRNRAAFLGLLFFSALLWNSIALAEFNFDPTLRSGDRRTPLLEKETPPPPKPEIIPPAPSGKKRPPAPKIPLGPKIGVRVKQIRTTGNKTFSDAELSAITSSYLNRVLYYEDLEEVRQKLTQHYIQHGYVNSGAVLPDQKITGGVVTFVIVEGELAAVDVRGNRWLRDWFYTSRIRRDAGPPVNIYAIEQRLQMLQQHGMVKKLRAEFKPGLEPGRSILALNVEEHLPFNLWIAANNYQSSSVGAERGLVTMKHQSLTGLGDSFSLTYGRSEGVDPLFDLAYRLPFTPWDTELALRYRLNDFNIVEEPFQDLELESESEIMEIKLRQPVWRTPTQEVALGLTGERLYSKSTILGGIPFSFTAGPEKGESVVAALRFSQEYLLRSRRRVLAAESRFSWGLDILDATRHDNHDPDGQFFTWLGQFQYTNIITPLDLQAILRTDLQLANAPLLALEQFSLGGRYSVRGYRENQLVRDNGVIASLEIRVPLAQNRIRADELQLIPFFDYGQGWNTERPTPEPLTIYSTGIGLRWGLTIVKRPMPIKTELEVYWGYPLEEISPGGDNLQDEGIHFQLAVSAF